ncbi:MAG: VOC family protein [Myxococcales bacterium]|nr:VOC family protein [Myxococcales bacterium]
MPIIEQLGYLGLGVSDLEAWERFATHVLGLGVSRRADDGAFALRMDGHAHRFLVYPDPLDDLRFVGWQVADAAALDEASARLERAGTKVTRGTAEERADRAVRDLVKFTDPGGIPVELFHGPAMAKEPFRSDVVGSHFVADTMGLGHLVLSTRDRDACRDFYMEVFGFKLSDYIICDIGGYHVDVCFMHVNKRHHSLALGGPMPKRIHHFMLQVGAMDDVGLAYDRARDDGVVIENELGRHPNDRMFSFYAQTPSGFQFEFGWGGREIDDATWEPTTYHQISEWGHRRPPRRRPKT